MKKYNLQGLGAVAISGLMLTSCGGLNKMQKNVSELDFTVTPTVLEAKGDSVSVSVSTKIPTKYFSKKAVVVATPVIIAENGEEFAFESEILQGEGAAGNGTVVNYKEATSISYDDVISYADAMEVGELKIKFSGTQGSKELSFYSDAIAQGTKTTCFLVVNDDLFILGKDAFERVTSHSFNAEFNYSINSSFVSYKELRDEDVKELSAFVKENASNERISFQKLFIDAYASPDGELSENTDLAKERAETAEKAVVKVLKQYKVDASADGFVELEPKGEDWDGFKKLMQASDIEDKEIIIRVLEQYSDVEQREKEIENIAATYEIVKKQILPQLRRAEVALQYEKTGYSDEELKEIVKSEPSKLNVEELLFTATLFDDLNEKLSIYKIAETQFPQDWRGANNVGVVLVEMDDLEGAAAQFSKSNAIENSSVSRNNLGIIARFSGERDEAKELIESALDLGSDVSYNRGILAIQDGDYDMAVEKMDGYNTLNDGLALILAGNPEKAITVIDASEESDSALGYYLKAVAGARMENEGVVVANLKSAISIDPLLVAKASIDVEFLDFRDAEAFKAIVE